MLIIKVKKGDRIDKYLKQFKKKFDKAGVLKELRRRMHYVKPSIKRRDEVLKAKYLQQYKIQMEQ